jgi:hypothetical protein
LYPQGFLWGTYSQAFRGAAAVANAQQPLKPRSELLRRNKLKALPTGEKMGKAFVIKFVPV